MKIDDGIPQAPTGSNIGLVIIADVKPTAAHGSNVPDVGDGCLSNEEGATMQSDGDSPSEADNK